MARITKETVETFIELIEGRWEPEFFEIKNKFVPTCDEHLERGCDCRTKRSEVLRNHLTSGLIQRVRRKFKKQDPPLYFYCVESKFKLLESSNDRLSIIRKLDKSTTGFAKSTNHILLDTARLYPQSAKRFLGRIQASFDIIIKLATGTIKELEDELVKEVKNEDSNKQD